MASLTTSDDGGVAAFTVEIRDVRAMVQSPGRTKTPRRNKLEHAQHQPAATDSVHSPRT